MTETEGTEETSPQLGNETYDHVYVESWKATLAECEKRLEPKDYENAVGVKTIEDFRTKLHELETKYAKGTPKQVIMLLYPTLDHYEQFAQSFVKMMSNKVSVSMLWGLLYLVITLSLESKRTIDRIVGMLEEIAYKLQRLNQCALVLPTGYVEIINDASKVHREILVLWLNITGVFREKTHQMKVNHAVDELTTFYEQAMQTIGDAVARVENMAEMIDQQVRMIDHEVFRKLLQEQHGQTAEKGRLPCVMLPFAENRKFFGREQDLEAVESQLQPTSDTEELRSAALWGMGGIGKTQCALAYSHMQRGRLDAVFWVAAETELTIQQGFSRIAHEGLRLPGTTADDLVKNGVQFHNWLKDTTCKWLLVFDNVEDHHLLVSNWPVARRGAILVTTRHPGVAALPVDSGIELKVFTQVEGAKLLYKLLGRDRGSNIEEESAMELSQLLNGFPLAINQMAAYISSKGISIKGFVDLYRKYPQRLRKERKAGWKYVGYDHALDTVWDISFDLLTREGQALLSSLSFLDPDSIPLGLLSAAVSQLSFENVSYLEDDLALWDAIESITASALVRNDSATETLSMHRLVRAETLFRLNLNERQGAFDTAVRLIRNDFPSRGLSTSRLDLWDIGLKYLPHIVVLANDWHDSQRRSEPLGATIDLCELMCDANFFVQDNDPASVLSLSANVAGEAFEKLPIDKRSKRLAASVYNALSFTDLKTGAFKSARELAQKALEAQLSIVGPDDITMATAYNLTALALDSECKHVEAERWWLKAVALSEGKTEEVTRRLYMRDNLNFSRNRYCTEDFGEALRRANLSLAASETYKRSWHTTAFIYQTFASLYTRKKDLVKAREHVDIAQKALDDVGGQATTSWVAYLVAHRSAQVAVAQNRSSDAIESAQKAISMGRLYKVMTGMLARSTYLLYRAYSLDPSYQDEAEKARKDAQKLRELLPPGRTDLADESEEAYERLVEIIQR